MKEIYYALKFFFQNYKNFPKFVKRANESFLIVEQLTAQIKNDGYQIKYSVTEDNFPCVELVRPEKRVFIPGIRYS